MGRRLWRPRPPRGTVLWHTDGDGVLFPDQVWIDGLFRPLPELGFAPRIDRPTFEGRVATQRATDTGMSRIEAVLRVFEEAVEGGDFPGVSDEVLRQIGRNTPMFRGAHETFLSIARQVRRESGGTAGLDIVINSCGWQPVLEGLFERTASALKLDRLPVNIRVMGQKISIVDRPGGGKTAQSARPIYDKRAKRTQLEQDLGRPGVNLRNVVLTIDGPTDIPMAAANRRYGHTIQIVNLTARDRSCVGDTYRQLKEAEPERPQMRPVMPDWSIGGPVHRSLATFVAKAVNRILSNERSPAKAPTEMSMR